MTAEELIKELRRVPPDAEVWLDSGDPYDQAPVATVRFEAEGIAFGGSRNPEVKMGHSAVWLQA